MQWRNLDTAASRAEFRDAIFDMYARTYANLGLNIPDSAALSVSADRWAVHLTDRGVPDAFHLARTTDYGLKSVGSGSDGTVGGKRAIIAAIRHWPTVVGQYGEVSHRVEEIVMRAGAPAVCATDVPRIIRRPILDILPDLLHYRRMLANVGVVKKIMVGRPHGIATTDIHAITCPVGLGGRGQSSSRAADRSAQALLSHLYSLQPL